MSLTISQVLPLSLSLLIVQKIKVLGVKERMGREKQKG